MTSIATEPAGQSTMTQKTRHLSLSDVRTWRPDTASPQLSHLMECESCRCAVGRALLLRRVISPPAKAVGTAHVAPQELRQFHDFVFLADEPGSLTPETFLRIFSHIESCDVCLEALIELDEQSKPSGDAINSILERMESGVSAPERKRAAFASVLPKRIGTVNLVITPNDFLINFVPYGKYSGTVSMTRVAAREPSSGHSGGTPVHIEPAMLAMRKTSASYLSRGEREDSPAAIPLELRISVGTSIVRLGISRAQSNAKAKVTVVEKSSGRPREGFRIALELGDKGSVYRSRRRPVLTNSRGFAEISIPLRQIAKSTDMSSIEVFNSGLLFSDSGTGDTFDLRLTCSEA
jgi:hypothetical protein